MMRLIWFWSHILISSYKHEKWHFVSKPIIFNVKVWFFRASPLVDTFGTPPRQEPHPLAMYSIFVVSEVIKQLEFHRNPSRSFRESDKFQVFPIPRGCNPYVESKNHSPGVAFVFFSKQTSISRYLQKRPHKVKMKVEECNFRDSRGWL